MPRTYSPRRRNIKRRQYRRKRQYRRGNRNNLQGFISGFPKTRFANLRYCTSFTLTSTLGLTDTHKFRCIGPYDPDQTAIGHQPMNWSLWEALYGRVMVAGSKLELSILPTNAAQNDGAVACYTSDDTSTPYSSIDGFIEARKGPYALLGQTKGKTKITSRFSTKKYYNVKDLKDNFDRLGSLTSGLPSEDPLFNVVYQDLGAGTSNVRIYAVLTYACLFSDPIDQGQS